MGTARAEELDKLISDRPESCRRPSKQLEPEVSALSHMAAAQGRMSLAQLQPQPLMTLSLQSMPLHHQLQPQPRIAPDSPAPAQTPPLHTLPDGSRSPLPHHPMGRAPQDFLNVTADMNTEVDALDPSIMDFALQGTGGRNWGGEGHDLYPEYITRGVTELKTLSAGCCSATYLALSAFLPCAGWDSSLPSWFKCWHCSRGEQGHPAALHPELCLSPWFLPSVKELPQLGMAAGFLVSTG